MNEKSANDELKETEVSDRTAARRANRTAKRSSVRPTSLRRKAAEEEPAAAPAAKKKKAKPRASTAKAPARKLSTSKSKPAKKKKTVAKPRAKPAKKKMVDSEYELRSQPDGTLRRVKISKEAKPVIMRRQRGSDTGPGPAIVDIASMGTGLWSREREVAADPLSSEVKDSVNFLKRRIGIKPKVAVVLGSGLSEVADLVEDEKIEFSDIPGFNIPKVPGHPGFVRAGVYEGTPVIFSAGRPHFYETGSMDMTVHPVRAFIALGIERLIITTSAGAVDPSYKVGNIMFVEDHINLMGDNPLFGLDPQSKPSVFFDVSSVYDKEALEASDTLSRRARLRPQKGTLAAVRGPVYETPAEINWLKTIGADAVCMSMVPEALEAARCGVPVTGLALITNSVAIQRKKPLSHEDVTAEGERNAARLKRLISYLLAQ